MQRSHKSGCGEKYNHFFRSELPIQTWQYGQKPTNIVPELAQYCTFIMGNIWAANTMLGITLQENIFANNNKEAYLEHAELTSKAIMDAYPNCRAVANTFRFDQYKGIRYYTTLYITIDFMYQRNTHPI
jgi:hypothetical protein